MSSEIKSVAVLGTGVEATQIAAQIANIGIPVLLLGEQGPEGKDPSLEAKEALDRLREADPSPFMHADRIGLITPGNWEDDLASLRGADWILEGVVGDMKVKQRIYRKIEFTRRPGTLVSTVCSSFTMAALAEDMGDELREDFLGAVFQLPVRLSRIVEIVPTSATRPDAVGIVADFCDKMLGKTVLVAQDKKGFIVRRLAAFAWQAGLHAAQECGLSVEEADAIASKALGFPKVGVFAWLDAKGVGAALTEAREIASALSDEDPLVQGLRTLSLLDRMAAEKQSFYRTRKTESGKAREVFALADGDYKPFAAPSFSFPEMTGKALRELCEGEDKTAMFAWRVLSQTLLYAAHLAPELAEDFTFVDVAMRLGNGFALGPFEMIDKLGAPWFVGRLANEGEPIPELLEMAAKAEGFYRVRKWQRVRLAGEGEYVPLRRASGSLVLSDLKATSDPVAHNPSATLWNIGDGVLCLEFHSKMNALDESIFDMMETAIAIVGPKSQEWRGLVIHNEAEHFSVGANLGVFRDTIKAERWDALDSFIRKGQKAHHALRFAPFPVVAAPSGLALGGGCEVLLHSCAIQALAETYPGLVEVGVGVIPGWGGCTQSLVRAFEARQRLGENLIPVNFVFESIMQARVAKSALGARDLLFLRPTDGVTMNKDRLLFDAKQKVLELAKDYRAPEKACLALPGKGGKAALMLTLESWKSAGKIGPHDEKIGAELAEVLSGGSYASKGPVCEEDLMDLERMAFLALCRTPESLARIEYMLANGKPLKN